MNLGAIQWPTLLSHEREQRSWSEKIRIVSIVQTNIPKTARKRFRVPNEICPGPNSWLMHEGGRKLFSVPLLITALTQFGSSFRVGEMRHCMNKTGKLIPPAKRSWAAKENNGNGEAFSERSGEKVEWRNGEQSSVREKEVREKKMVCAINEIAVACCMHTKVVFPPKTWTRDERTGEIDAHTNSDYDSKIFPARTYCSSGLWPFYVTNFRRMKMCRRKITVGFNEPSPRLFILWLGCYAIPRLSRRQRRRRKCNFIIMKNSTSLVKARKRAGRIPENAKFLLPFLSVFRRQFCFMGTLTLDPMWKPFRNGGWKRTGEKFFIELWEESGKLSQGKKLFILTTDREIGRYLNFENNGQATDSGSSFCHFNFLPW